MPRTRLDPLITFGVPLDGGGIQIPNRGTDWFVSTFNNINTLTAGLSLGNDSNSGKSWDRPLLTMGEALDRAKTHDRIFFVGKITEELVGSNLKFDISIIGCGGTHHADQPGTAPALYDYGSAVWAPPSSPTATTPLIEVRGRGWKFYNILFDVPVDDAAIKLVRNASSGTSEYDSSHAVVYGCRFTDGDIAIENSGGAGFVRVERCQFQRLNATSSSAGIKCTSTSVAVPLNWVIRENEFHNNSSHILSSMSYSTIRGNTFGIFSQTLSIDIDDQPSANQGTGNVIWGNYLSGTYGATAYPPGTGNEWAGNFNSLSGGVTAADPV